MVAIKPLVSVKTRGKPSIMLTLRMPVVYPHNHIQMTTLPSILHQIQLIFKRGVAAELFRLSGLLVKSYHNLRTIAIHNAALPFAAVLKFLMDKVMTMIRGMILKATVQS